MHSVEFNNEMPLPSGLLISSRVALKSTSSFSSVLQQFARTAVSKEKGGISGAWTQLMDPLPQRGETNMARGEKLGEVDLKWLEELKKRRSVDSSPASRGDGGGSARQREEVELESEPWVQQTLEETNVRAGEMGLFAYPAASSRWTRFPLASMGMLLAVLGVSAELSYMMTKQGEEGDELTMTSIRNRAERAVDYVYTMAVEKDDNLKLTSLVTCSLLHPEGDSSRASRLVSGALLLTTGAIMERLYGPVRYLGVVTAVTAISNFVGLQLSGTELPLLGSSPAVFFGAGYLGMLRPFSMWACLPNIPIPCLWLMAPITVSLTTRAWRLLGSRSTCADAEEAEPRPYEHLTNRELRRLMSCIAVQLAMLETAQARESEADNMLYHTTFSTSEMNSNMASLEEQLEALRHEWSTRRGWPSDRCAGLVSDLSALLFGLGCAYLTRGRFRGKFPVT